MKDNKVSGHFLLQKDGDELMLLNNKAKFGSLGCSGIF